MDQVNGSVISPGACPDDCTGCASMRRLFKLADRLNGRGLESRFDRCDVRTPDGHIDSLIVTNPAAPERGALHIDLDGGVTWEFPGSKLDDDGIGRLVDEAINSLRASGVRLPRRQVTES